MNWIQFIRLIYIIYRKRGPLPNLTWIEKQGLLAVKLGQVHALRIDFLPREKCLHLAKLFRQNASLPPEKIRPLLESYAGRDFFDNFSTFNTAPIASASVGQVHHATLKNGQPVAVKVIKRDVRQQFQKDVKQIRRFFDWVAFFYPKLKKVGDPIGILNDIQEYTLSELDLQHEIEGHRTLRSIHKENKIRFNLSNLHFAEIYEELSNSNVLVSDYIEGQTFDALLDKNALDYDQLLELFHIHGFYIFIIGTFHGDIHPGNIILNQKGIHFVDTGYIGHVGDKIRKGLFNFFSALSQWDYPMCAKALNDMSEPGISGQAFTDFKIKFIDLYKDFKNTTVSQVSLTKKMMQTIKLGVHNGMTFEKGIFAVIRSLMYLDGMVLRCNPQAILLKDMRRFIDEFKALI